MSPAHAVDLDEAFGCTAGGDRNAVDVESRDWTLALSRVSDIHGPGLIRAPVRPQLAAEIDESSVYTSRVESIGCGTKCGSLSEASSVDPSGCHVSRDNTGALVD